MSGELEIPGKGLKRATPEALRRLGAHPLLEGQPPRSLPPKYSFFGMFDRVDNQGQTNTCVAHGSVAEAEAFAKKHHAMTIEISRRALYWRAKKEYEPTDMADDGLSVADGLNVIKNFGYVLESDWPFDPANLFAPVPDELWKTDFKVRELVAVDRGRDAAKTALFQHGPIVVGGQWPDEWMSPGADGALSASPSPSSEGHCTVWVAYDDDAFFPDAGWTQPGGIFGRNSWGENWGRHGHFWLPYALLDTDFAPWEAYAVRA